MTTRNWIGGGDNQASNPNNWSPTGAPQAGDTLDLGDKATINVSDNTLAGDVLQIAPNGATDTINVSGSTEMKWAGEYGETVTINLGDGSQWTGGLSSGPSDRVTVNGSGTFANQASTANGTVVVNVPVTGTGTFAEYQAHSAGKLEFAQSVSAGQSVSVSGYQGYSEEFGVLQIDDLASYHADTTLGFGEIVLKGLAVDSYTLSNDVLTLFKGANVVGSMSLHQATVGGFGPQDFGVSQTDAGVVIHADGTAYKDGGTLLGAPAPTSPPPIQAPPTPNPVPPPPAPPQPPTPGPTPTPPPGQPGQPPTVNTDTHVVVNTTTTASASNATVVNGGNTPTPLAPNEVSGVALAANLNPSAGGSATFFYDGGHLGHDFDNLGNAISSGQDQAPYVNQTISNMKELLAAYISSAANLGTRGVVGQFVVDVVNASIKAVQIGDAGLDHAYGGAVTQFFGTETSLLVGMGH